MRWIKMESLRGGQININGELGVGKFAVAEVDEIVFKFKNWKEINMGKGTIEEKGNDGIVVYKKISGGMTILNKKEIKKLKMIENKMKMLENLKDKEDEK